VRGKVRGVCGRGKLIVPQTISKTETTRTGRMSQKPKKAVEQDNEKVTALGPRLANPMYNNNAKCNQRTYITQGRLWIKKVNKNKKKYHKEGALTYTIACTYNTDRSETACQEGGVEQTTKHSVVGEGHQEGGPGIPEKEWWKEWDGMSGWQGVKDCACVSKSTRGTKKNHQLNIKDRKKKKRVIGCHPGSTKHKPTSVQIAGGTGTIRGGSRHQLTGRFARPGEGWVAGVSQSQGQKQQ